MKVTVDLKLLDRRIKEARHRRKLTQAKVGEEIGVSDSYISRIETGKARMSMYRFFTMATLLQVEPSDLLVGCCPDIKPDSTTPEDSPEKAHLRELIDRASPSMLKTMCVVCDALMHNANEGK